MNKIRSWFHGLLCAFTLSISSACFADMLPQRCEPLSHGVITTKDIMAMATSCPRASREHRSESISTIGGIGGLQMKFPSHKDIRGRWKKKPDMRTQILDAALAGIENEYEEAISRTRTPTGAFSIGLNFTAASVADVQEPFVIPPNLNGWVGPTQYVLMSYGIIRSFSSATGQPDGVLNIDATNFFGTYAGDVRISYDRFSSRWFLSCEGTDPIAGIPSTIVLAVSRDATLTADTLWDFYTFSNGQMAPQVNQALGVGFLDYQQLANDAHATYISVDAFDLNGSFLGTSLLVIQKSSLLNGPLVSNVFYNIRPVPTGNPSVGYSGFVPAADNFDSNPTYGYLVASSNGYLGSTYNQLFLYRISNPGSATPSLGNQVIISVPTYADPQNAPHKGNLFGANGYLQTGWATIAAPHIRNKQLYLCHGTQVKVTAGVPAGDKTGDRIGIRWYQFDLTGDATAQGTGTELVSTIPAQIQTGILCDSVSVTNPNFYFIPSIMTNKNGAMVIACTVSGLNTYTNATSAARLSTDTLGTLQTELRLTSNTTNPYNFGPFVNPSNGNIGQRWGDLSSLCPDPNDDTTIWATQEWASVYNGWGIQATQLLQN